ncbi:MAG TPA: phospho-sugar mutase [Bacteroidales bacterium]|nr:phospho-sugar mutase [Bacteroidales bacterium]
MSEELLEMVIAKAKMWLTADYDMETRDKVRYLLENDEEGLVDAFYQDLEFGTGGLRGIMGAGTNRMNKYTLGMASQGLANYLKKQFGQSEVIKVAIGHDCRNNSRYFAETAAGIFAANGFEVYLFESLRPTPELSFTIRHLGCKSGVIITASHNPPEYNGYKAYWDDGGQVTAPHDENIITEAKKINSVSEILFGGPPEKIHIIGKEIDELFIEAILQVSLDRESINKHHDLGIVYTPIHGTGVKIVPQTLKRFGFTNIINVEEQDVIDGNFPTVRSPNPEEADALKMAIEKAEKTNAELVMATDPDADRIGIAVKNRSGQFVLLNGNQTGVILTWYIIHQYIKKGLLKGNEYIIKTIVTSDLFERIAEKNGIKCFNVLTGFKYFASLIKKLEGSMKYICGGEESYGYLPGDYVRDKDAVASCAMVAETAAYAAAMGKTLFELLISVYAEYGFYKEKLFNIVRKGKDGAEEINNMMIRFRKSPPKKINRSKVVRINDYKSLISRNIITGERQNLEIESSNVLQFFLEDGSKISVRPSGTEPKIKFYFSVNKKLDSINGFESTEAELDSRIDAIIKDMNLV